MEHLNLELNESNRIVTFEIDPENPYLELKATGGGHNSDETEVRLYASVKVTIKKTNQQPQHKTVDFNNNNWSDFSPLNTLIPTIDNASFESVTLELLEGNTLQNFEIRFNGTHGIKMIQMQSPIEKFDLFVNDRINSKIMFSAPFGEGKSTFLNHYFKEINSHRYCVFTLYPVNYSVASNKDIFTYLKADILIQLLATGVEFDRESINFLQAAREYFYLNPKKAIFSLLEKLSSIHSSTEILNKGLDSLHSLVKQIQEYQKDQDINDQEKAIGFIKDLYENEGTLFEDNFYTQLIRQLLERLKQETNKPNILIIEDLDRMDPDHIFRILNVISAHYDTYKFSDETEYANKFGFDKIIVVADIANIENIFHHKYGEKTDFKGYINKFFSRTPFQYDNKKQISIFIEETNRKLSLNGIVNPFNDKLIQLLKMFHEHDLISLREIIKINTFDFSNYKIEKIQDNTLLSMGPYSKALLFLKDFYGSQKLINKIEKIKSEINFENYHYESDAQILLASLGLAKAGHKISIVEDSVYKFTIKENFDFDCIKSVHEIICQDLEMNPKPMDLRFHFKDFCKLLIENIKRIEDKTKNSKS